MKSPHILLLNKNVVEIRNELSGVLSKKSAKAIEAEVKRNVVQLFSLGEQHHNFARTTSNAHWRQVVSRAYYGAYGVSRAVRLATKGAYSQETKDHEKIAELPDDFPDRATYANRLRVLRDDRNLCDYDHSADQADLAISVADAIALVDAFLTHARTYLRARRFHV